MSDDNKYTYPDSSHVVITDKVVDTPALRTDELRIGYDSIKEIVHNLTHPSVTKVPSSNAVFEMYKQLVNKLDLIDPNNNIFIDNTVITLPIINRYISNENWVTTNWELTLDKKHIYTGSAGGNITNNLYTAQYPFNRTGEYFVNVTVDVLDSGKLIAYDQDNNILATAVSPGQMMFPMQVDIPSTARLYLKATDTYDNEVVVISAVDIYYTTDRLRQFLAYYIPVALSNEYNFVSEDDLRIALKLFSDEIGLDNLPDYNHLFMAVNHMSVYNSNVHQETPSSIGAAPAIHGHTPESINAADRNHTHTLAELGAAADDHTHIPSSIGAANEVHLHNPADCGAAPIIHEHSSYATKQEIKKLSGKYLIPMSIISNDTSKLPMFVGGTSATSFVSQNCIIGSETLMHGTDGPIDQYSGNIYTNMVPVSGGIGNIFNVVTDEITTFTNPTASNVLTINYRFPCRRSIIGYTIYRTVTDGVVDTTVSVPTSWRVSLDKDLYHQQTVTWEPTDRYKFFAISDVDELSTFTISITGVNTTTVANTGFKILLKYAEEGSVVQIVDNHLGVTSDTDGNMLPISIIPNKITVLSVTDNGYIYPYVTYENDKVVTGYSIFAPEYGYKREGYPLFKEEARSAEDIPEEGSLRNNATTAYGNILTDTTTSTMMGIDVLKLFDYPTNYSTTARLFKCAKNCTVTITDMPHVHLVGWRLYLKQRTTNTVNPNVPTQITITYTRSSTNYNGYDGTDTVTIPDRDEYGYMVTEGVLDENGVLHYKGVYIHDIVDTALPYTAIKFNVLNGQNVNGPITNITEMIIGFNNTNTGATHNEIYGLKLTFGDDFYDVTTGIMYDCYNLPINGKLYLGQCKYIANRGEYSFNGTQTYSVGTTNSTDIAISGSSDNTRTTITIPNPYFSTDIHCVNSALSESDMYKYIAASVLLDEAQLSIKTPMFAIEEITCKDITISTVTGDTVATITRQW